MFKELQEKNIGGISSRTNLGIPGRARKTCPGTTPLRNFGATNATNF